MAWRDEPKDGERRSWHGFGQPRPKLPAYLRPSKRTSRPGEFERAAWSPPASVDDNRVTLGGVARETLRWLVLFLIIGIITVSAWRWLYGDQTCVEVFRGFKMGWC